MIESITENIIGFVLAFFVIVIGIGLGKKLLKNVGLYEDKLEIALFSGVIGVGLLGSILFFLGIFKLFYLSVIFIMLVIGIIVLRKDIRDAVEQYVYIIKDMIRQDNKIGKFSIIILIIFIIGNGIFATTPEVQWDSMVYHLTVPKIYAQNHQIIEIVDDYHSYLPKQTDILFTISEIAGIKKSSKIIMFLFNLFLVGGIYVFTKKVWNKKAAIIATTIFYTIPNSTIYQPTTYNDLALSSFLFFSIYAYVNARKNKKWFYVCGILLGFAAATKIIAIGMLGFFILLLLLDKRSQILLKNRIIWICVIALITVAILSPWLIITAMQTGNPVYPFFYKIVGGHNWSPELDEFWDDLRQEYGTGGSLKSFIFTPWTMTMNPMKYGSIYGYTPLFFIFIPLMFVRKYKKEEALFILFIGYYMILWFILARDGRYIFPILAPCSIIAGISIIEIAKNKRRLVERAIWTILIIILLSNIFFGGIINRNVIANTIGIQNEAIYLQNHIQNYETVMWINGHLKNNNIKIFVANDDRTYYLEAEYLRGYPIIQGYINYVELGSSEALYMRLQKERITHIMLTRHKTDYEITLTPFPFKYNELIEDMFEELVTNHGKLLIEKNDVEVYELDKINLS